MGGRLTVTEVEDVFSSGAAGDVVEVRVGGESIEVTVEHPSLVASGEAAECRAAPAEQEASGESAKVSAGRWVAARDLDAGDLLGRAGSGGHRVAETRLHLAERSSLARTSVTGNDPPTLRTRGVGRVLEVGSGARVIVRKSSLVLASFGLIVGVALGMFLSPHLLGDGGRDSASGGAGSRDERAEAEIRRLYEIEHDNLLRMDIAGQERFLPDDFVVTNPFGMFIDKSTVIERLHANIIKYSKYERGFEYFRRHGDTMIVAGTEIVEPTLDANRPDAGKTVRRRFTEVWVLRNGAWEKVARHASNLPEA